MCETEGSSIPLFLQYWWMEAVCHGKQWDVALAYDNNGSIISALPYLIGSKMGLRYILQPQLTQYNGPWYRTPAHQQYADTQLLAHLQSLRLALFQQNFAPSVTHLNQWSQYRQSPRITYRINDISNPRNVFDHFDKRRRQRHILQAEKILVPDYGLTPELFAQFHSDYWNSRGRDDLLTHHFMVRVITAALNRSQGILLGLRDSNGTLQAARFVVYDSHCAFSLLSALGKQHHNGASPLLFWLILQQLSDKCPTFDFEGSMDPGIAYSYSLYGAQPTTYFQLTRCPNPLLRRLLKL